MMRENDQNRRHKPATKPVVWGVLAAMTLVVSMGRVVRAQDAPQHGTAIANPSYEVVTIKPDNSGNAYWRNTPDGFSTASTAANLIKSAYWLPTPDQIVGLPKWTGSELLDVQAKMDAETAAALGRLPPMEQWQQRQRMLRALLAERFALKVHPATKQLPIYVLTVANGGSKLKKSANDIGGSGMYSDGKIEAHSVSIENLVVNLSGMVGRVIVDKSGLPGGYDFSLEWAPVGADASDPRPSIFAALEEQLGLKLRPSQGPVDAIVVDSIERPTPN
jgi:uncharacterized protein (TIGR03435 family)